MWISRCLDTGGTEVIHDDVICYTGVMFNLCFIQKLTWMLVLPVLKYTTFLFLVISM